MSQRVAIVTGGASGIGAASARALGASGHEVVVTDLDGGGAAEVAAGLQAASAAALDVRDESAVEACVRAVVAERGRVDVLVNSAALTERDHHDADVDVASLSLDTWHATLATDLEGVLVMCKHVVPVMVGQGGGSIVNISSNSATGGDLVRSAYSAAKAGVESLTRSVAVAYGRAGVRCNAVSPGAIAGPSFARNLAPQLRQRMAASCLLPRLGRPEDVAALVDFLASERAGFITGQVIAVDGGVRAQLPHVPGAREAARDGRS